MIEDQWLACTDPILMLESLRDGGMDSEARKLRLFAAACCRRAWHLLDADGRTAVEVSERFADRSASQEELRAAVWANRGCQDIDARTAVDHAAVGAWRPAVALLAAVCGRPPAPDASPADPAALARERAAQADLLRDILGSRPLQPICVASSWRTPTVVALAQAAYENLWMPDGHLDAARLAILADAAEEAGCTDGDLLAHLRGPGPHVRGCWPVDEARVGLYREPFVAGVTEMIDRLVAGIPDAANGFRLLFAASSFAGHQAVLAWVRADPVEGNW